MEFKKTPLVECMVSICCSNIGDDGDDDDIANTFSSSINVDNIEMEGTGILVALSELVTLMYHIRTELMIWI